MLKTNRAFYEAFTKRDIEEMDELWAHRTPVACIHPGWPPLHGRGDVMASWRAILLGDNSPAIRCEDERVYAMGDSGFVTCIEIIGDDTLVATNFFVRESGVWQIVHHQASPVATMPPGEPLN